MNRVSTYIRRHATLKRLLRPVYRGLRRVAAFLGAVLLRREGPRNAINRSYERLGPRFTGTVCWLFSDAQIATPFQWTVQFGQQRLAIPVKPTLQRSWDDALFWSSPAASAYRTYYQWYLNSGASSRQGRSAVPLLLDVGANDGMYMYPFAAYGWNCVAFEPQASCIEYIREVCGLNDFRKVTTVQAAASDHSAADVEFFVSGASWYSSLDRAAVERFEPARVERVTLVTLDEYCSEHQLQPTALKIDAEGAEISVLAGAATVLSQNRPDLFIEIGSDEQRRALWELLEPLAYRLYVLTSTEAGTLQQAANFGQFLDLARGAPHDDIVALADEELRRQLESDFEL
jgi:FkbM family methyltransferase